jgi:protein gp37
MSTTTTDIAWTDRTWNPTRGCSIVSPGCTNCYAMKLAHRFSGPGKPYDGLTKQTPRSGPQWTGKVTTVESALLEPLSWRKPQRVFVNSMSDLFHQDVPDAFIDQVFATMAAGHNHTFQVLTKRPERMRRYVSDSALQDRIHWASLDRFGHTKDFDSQVDSWVYGRWPLPNVWLGVSVEDQPRADERIPLLLQTPAVVRFISAEPLLGRVDVIDWMDHECGDPPHGRCPAEIDWVIVGGESGPGARSFNLEWARSIVKQCTAASVPVFIKQLGAKPFVQYEVNGGTFTDPMIRPGDGKLADRKGGDMDEWPADLRVREFPADLRRRE